MRFPFVSRRQQHRRLENNINDDEYNNNIKDLHSSHSSPIQRITTEELEKEEQASEIKDEEFNRLQNMHKHQQYNNNNNQQQQHPDTVYTFNNNSRDDSGIGDVSTGSTAGAGYGSTARDSPSATTGTGNNSYGNLIPSGTGGSEGEAEGRLIEENEIIVSVARRPEQPSPRTGTGTTSAKKSIFGRALGLTSVHEIQAELFTRDCSELLDSQKVKELEKLDKTLMKFNNKKNNNNYNYHNNYNNILLNPMIAIKAARLQNIGGPTWGSPEDSIRQLSTDNNNYNNNNIKKKKKGNKRNDNNDNKVAEERNAGTGTSSPKTLDRGSTWGRRLSSLDAIFGWKRYGVRQDKFSSSNNDALADNKILEEDAVIVKVLPLDAPAISDINTRQLLPDLTKRNNNNNNNNNTAAGTLTAGTTATTTTTTRMQPVVRKERNAPIRVFPDRKRDNIRIPRQQQQQPSLPPSIDSAYTDGTSTTDDYYTSEEDDDHDNSSSSYYNNSSSLNNSLNIGGEKERRRRRRGGNNNEYNNHRNNNSDYDDDDGCQALASCTADFKSVLAEILLKDFGLSTGSLCLSSTCNGTTKNTREKQLRKRQQRQPRSSKL